MADIQKLTYPYFTDGTTPLNASNLNQIVAKINEVIDKVNGGVTPTQTVATPSISISSNQATITCSTSGATIYYTTNGNTPTTSSTQYSSPITLTGACTIKAIAVKSGMNNSSVASQSYSPSADPVQTIVNKIKAKMSGVGNKETAVYNLIDALGADTPSSGIWSKIKALYIPCLAVTADADNVFYDIISDTVQTEANSYKIEAKRGVMPETKGQSLSTHSLSVTADNTSMFGIVTQRTDATLGSSSGVFASFNGLNLNWQTQGMSCISASDTTSKIVTSTISDFANTPEAFALSAASGGSRTFVTNEESKTGSLSFTTTDNYRLASASYAALSVFGVCDGLTAAEAATVHSALQTFVTAYGIECSNS